MTARPATDSPTLVRAIGRWTLVALVVNSVIGSGIFGLPDDVVRLVGAGAPLAYLLAAAGIGVIMACFAEVSSQFTHAGGPYLYARRAFGPLAGLQVAWAAWLTRITAGAAIANLFVIYLGEFVPQATRPVPRALVLAAMIGGLAWVNVVGVRSGARLSTAITLAKLLPIALFVVVGLSLGGVQLDVQLGHGSRQQWLDALLLLVYAYGGFESVLMPAAEIREPRRDLPFALLTGLALITLVYMAIQLTVMAAFPDLAAFDRADVSARPVGEAARVLVGGWGPPLIAAGALLSAWGTLSAQLLTAPRLTFALAEQGEFPAVMARIHARFRTPWVSIVVHAALLTALAIAGSFVWNAVLSAVARLVTYASTCAALIALRRQAPGADRFRLPAGPALAGAGVLFCITLVAQLGREHLLVVLVVGGCAAANWWWARRPAAA